VLSLALVGCGAVFTGKRRPTPSPFSASRSFTFSKALMTLERENPDLHKREIKIFRTNAL